MILEKEGNLMDVEENKIIERKPFDIQEAVLLLDVYLEGKQKGITNTEAAHIASKRLRELAVNRGFKVASSFRSPMGLQNRLRSIGHLYEGTESVSAPGTKVFRKAVFLYKDDKRKYQQLLSKAGNFFDEKEIKTSSKKHEEGKKQQMDEELKKAEKKFLEWLPSSVPPYALKELTNSYRTVSSMLVQKKVLSQPLIATIQRDQIEDALKQTKKVFGSKRSRNNAAKLLVTYLEYLEEKRITKLEIGSPIDVEDNWIHFNFSNSQMFEQTVPVYCSLDGKKIEGENWARILVAIAENEIVGKNPAMDELYRKPLVSSRTQSPFLMKKKGDELNCSELSNGYWINVNWSIPHLLEMIQVLCLYCGYSKEQVIIYGAPKGSVSIRKTNLSDKKATKRSSDIEKVEDYLKEIGLHGATVQELVDVIQHGAAVYPINNALNSSVNVISMPKNRYVHADAFVDLDEAEEIMESILQTHFKQFGGYSNSKLLFGAACHDLSLFLNDNDCEDIDSVYSLAQYFFTKKTKKTYIFSYPHIFEKKSDYPLTLKGLMISLARMNDGILIADVAKEYLQKTMLSYGSIGQLLQISNSNIFLMYDSYRYLLSEKLGINKDWCQNLRERMDDLFKQSDVAYVIPRDISSSWYASLSLLPQGLSWTPLLLQEVLKKYPEIKFRSITSELTQSYNTIAAAFVPAESLLQSFPDVVTLYMQEHHELPKRMTCEELRIELRDAGMLEGNELIYALPKALNDYRFSWTDENKMVYVRGN